MLILSRKVGEVVCIGDDIEVVVVSVRSGGNIRLGIKAPKDVAAHRSEVKAAIDADEQRRRSCEQALEDL